jgi:hypothetical protein
VMSEPKFMVWFTVCFPVTDGTRLAGRLPRRV